MKSTTYNHIHDPFLSSHACTHAHRCRVGFGVHFTVSDRGVGLTRLRATRESKRPQHSRERSFEILDPDSYPPTACASQELIRDVRIFAHCVLPPHSLATFSATLSVKHEGSDTEPPPPLLHVTITSLSIAFDWPLHIQE